MTEEQSFLNAILSNPADTTAKLVYADWLDDRGDHRAEILRLKVKLTQLEPESAEFSIAQNRLNRLEPTASPNWLILLDGPVWCLAGNIIAEHPFGPGGQVTRSGTRLFRPNTKVYLSDLWNSAYILQPEALPFMRLRVIGQHRKSREWIESYVGVERTRNWRVQLLRQPGPMRRLKAAEWYGFNLPTGDFVCPGESTSPEAIRALIETLRGLHSRDR